MSILEICAAVFFGLVAIGLITGGSHRKMRQEAEKQEAIMKAKLEHEKAVDREYMNRKRNQLIKEREAHLLGIRRRNDEYMKKHGIPWSNEEKDMMEYDKANRRHWAELGMTPPSFVR